MERLAGWLWRTQRAHYPAVLGAVAWLQMIVLVLPLCVVAAGALFDFTWGDGALMVAIAAPVAAVGPVVAVSTAGATRRAITAWGRGDRSDPTAAWAAAVRAPTVWTERATLANSLALSATVVPALAPRIDLTLVEGLATTPVLLVVFAGFGLVLGTGFPLLLRPMVDEVLVELSGMPPPLTRGRWNVSVRFYLAIGSTCFLSGIVAAAAGFLADTRESRIVAATSVAAATAVYMLLLFGRLLVRPTLAPMADLARATERVRLGDVNQPVPVTSADELGELAVAFNEMQVGLRERAELQAAFGSYVDPVLAQRLIDSGSAMFEGEDLVVTVLFADVRDFTSYSERVEPSEAVQLLNRLFDVVVPVLQRHGGHANHYLGDGLLAVFGAPNPLDEHANAAVAAATEMQRRVRDVFGSEVRLGIGINTGPVIAGTVGGGGRHEFTVIGDTVNVAARVEQLTKETGDAILITEATRQALPAPRPRSTKRGAFNLKGKSAQVTVHAVNPFPRSTR